MGFGINPWKWQQTEHVTYPIVLDVVRLEMKVVKGSGNQQRLCFKCNSGNFFYPTGLDLIKTVKGTVGGMEVVPVCSDKFGLSYGHNSWSALSVQIVCFVVSSNCL